MKTHNIFYEIIINLVLITCVFGVAIEFTSGVYKTSNTRMRRDVTDEVAFTSQSTSISNSTEKPYDVMINANVGDESSKTGESVTSDSDDDDDDDDEDDIVTTTVKFVPPIPGNDLYIGNCSENDKMLYIDNTVIINDGPSILNGTIEIFIDATEPIKITCLHILDQVKDGTGGKPSYNSGGTGYDWVKIDVQGQYAKGFHFKTYVFGVPDEEKIRALKAAVAAAESIATTKDS